MIKIYPIFCILSMVAHGGSYTIINIRNFHHRMTRVNE